MKTEAKPKYRRPTFQRIARDEDAENLYDLERERNEAIDAAAQELGRILGFERSQYWTHSLPEELASILESYDRNASTIAAIAYLEKEGYTVSK